MTMRIDLTRLALPDVLQLMVTGSGSSWEDVAAACGWGPSNVNRIRDPRDDYWPTLPKVALFCVATRSTLLLDWFAAQVELGAVELDLEEMDCAGLIMTLGGLFAELGEVAVAGERAVHPESDLGEGISQNEARAIIRRLVGLINQANEAIARLRPIAGLIRD
ncbi:phage regulatory CII family protein [Pseudodesulfovibrio pelocollis]|uniref:phage regulatory CII family protein n=1 Tax=Pseudodesulfovibrio pelocollis TaxID=3051432 RepID=UPI00255B137E|nr:phage regulatory CII family protein [Pseudodesulfovibrio sp. SB368]